MAQALSRYQADVVVVGGGAAGIAASLAARQTGASVVLLEKNPTPGGELISGLPYLGTANALGEKIVGGPLDRILEMSAEFEGFHGLGWDGRLMYGSLVDPEIIRLCVTQSLAASGVRPFLGCAVDDVIVENDRIVGVIAHTKSGPAVFSADAIVDASGDADVVARAGGRVWMGDVDGALQPVSLTFRVSEVDYTAFLDFIASSPDEFVLAENPVFQMTPEECAKKVAASGLPFVMLSGESSGSLLRTAIESGEMYPTTGMWMWPTSPKRRELGFNTTRLSGVNGLDTESVSQALSGLGGQVRQAIKFVTSKLPGFENAVLSGVAPRVGIRETRRVRGQEVLTTDAALNGVKRIDGVAKGAHHIDLHGDGTFQKRVPIRDGKSYDIPFGALIPERHSNVVVAGRCLSSEREANGSARVIGTSMSTGHAAGVASAMYAADRPNHMMDLSIEKIRATIRQQQGIVDGTN